LQYIFSCTSPTGLATCTYSFDFRLANTRATNFVIHPFCVVRDEGIRLQGYKSNRYICILNCWLNLRVHTPQNSGYRLLTSFKPLSFARCNCKPGAACDLYVRRYIVVASTPADIITTVPRVPAVTG
jgi:hypothetical protein